MTKSSWPSNLPVDNQQLVGAALGLIILVVAAVLLRPSELRIVLATARILPASQSPPLLPFDRFDSPVAFYS